MTWPDFPSWMPEALIVAMATVALWAVALAIRALRRRRTPVAVAVTAIAAAACTAYSADTSWRFAADYLDMSGTTERAAMFGTAELALFATALMARQNLNGPHRAPGVPGVLVWLITGVQVIPAYSESGLVGGTVRAFVGPLLAALLWHLAMGIELRHRKPQAESYGVAARLGRELRERFLSRLGVVERDRDAAQITRDRATARAVALAAKLAQKTPEQRGRWLGRRTARRLSAAVARASVGIDARQRRSLLNQLAARRHALELATIALSSPWEERPDPAASALAAHTREEMRRATGQIRQSSGYPRVLFADVGPGHGVNAQDCSPEHTPDGRLDGGEGEADEPTARLATEEARAVIKAGWREGLTVRQTAQRATRAPSFVQGIFAKLDAEHGPRPARGPLAAVNDTNTARTGQ